MERPAGPIERPNAGARGVIEQSAITIAVLVAVLWIAEIVDVVADHRLDRWGVQPRTIRGLRGIPLAPLLHSGFGHLFGNTVPFAAMGFLVLSGGARRFVFATVVIIIVSGAGMWLLGGSNEIHIGASGVVFGYLGYLMSRGFFERKLGQIAIGVVVGVIYGGLLWGVLPTQSGVSWQGHLFGFIGGVLAARLLAEESAEEKQGSPAV